MMFQEDVNIKRDNCPICLIDNSGSTNQKVKTKMYGEITILKYTLLKAQNYFVSIGVKNIYLMLWNDRASIFSFEPIDVSSLDSPVLITKYGGGTILGEALKSIPEKWINTKKFTEMYIFTDGEITDDDKIITTLFTNLFDSNTKIQIITVEPNDINYMLSNCNAGTKIFGIIQQAKLTSRVRRFSSYNGFHEDEPFIWFDNPDEISGYAPFRGKYFNIDKSSDDFIDFIEEEVVKCDSKEDVVKIAHELTLTISHMTKDSSDEQKLEINNSFADLFSLNDHVPPNMFKQINNLLLIESDRHTNGEATTYQGFKDAIVCV